MKLSATATFRPRNDLGQFVPAKFGPAVTASVQAACATIQRAAQAYCPVDTGALRESITVQVEETGSTVVGRVGPHTDYAAFVEFGTGGRGASSPGAGPGPYGSRAGQVAQPYMRPAYDETRPTILDLFRGNLATALR